MSDEPTCGCPTTGRWADLLVDHVSSPERSRLEDHLETCEGCRQTLEQLATNPSEWETWGRRLKASQVVWPARPEPRDAPIEPIPTPSVPGYEVLGVLGRG